MKKKTISIESISLDKETIARLDEVQLSAAVGAGTYSCKAAEQLEAFEDEFAADTCCKGSCGTTGC
ncbi:hypothetical protein LV89_04227 [Arcicella aurantiaca]|uniref:Uncharacterized protein n=1 Tax=Arcicella aurantiaca TaxID=591202 RepID=A0A316DK69_9BACT|nr:class I lanthipeptide [Arcicella aurantiaca]PWK18076.1 hypothetical protein LV89_04227 [Arcicella aurantiaca]